MSWRRFTKRARSRVTDDVGRRNAPYYARTHYGDGFAAGPAAGAAYGSAAGFGSVNSGHGWGGGAGPAPGSVTGSWFAEEDFE